MTKNGIELWGGIEGTINRVGDNYLDQCEYAGHYEREEDLDLIASLGISRLRYPILWEKHQPAPDTEIDWSYARRRLEKLRDLGVQPIVGLVHHGSGPAWVNFFDGSFEKGVAEYAALVAAEFPWVQNYTPVNEPLTTARFCGLYGHWYPHAKNDLSFYRILLSECRAVGMAMEAIRKINPAARLIQTEDLGKTYSTSLLEYQAEFENTRRWLSYDLLCGRVDEQHPLWFYLTKTVGLAPEEFDYFIEHPCVPDVCGFNYYLTSERYLDEDLSLYPPHTHGGNGVVRYADVEAIRVPLSEDSGAYVVLKEAWEHLHLPLAITECHLYCTREEQLRWVKEKWQTLQILRAEGVDIRALTAWALLGLHGWDDLVRSPWGTYEAGVFKLRNGVMVPTALCKLLRALGEGKDFHHPTINAAGWWQREFRLLYPPSNIVEMNGGQQKVHSQPLLIAGRSGALTDSLVGTCDVRNLPVVLLPVSEHTKGMEIGSTLEQADPWAVVMTPETGQNKLSRAARRAQEEHLLCLAELCRQRNLPLVVILPDGERRLLQQAGDKSASTFPADKIREIYPEALVIRTGQLFGPGVQEDLVSPLLSALRKGRPLSACLQEGQQPAYIPDVIHSALDLLLDEEKGLFWLTHDVSEKNRDRSLAPGAKGKKNGKTAGTPSTVAFPAPLREQVITETMPALTDALQRFQEARSKQYGNTAVAV